MSRNRTNIGASMLQPGRRTSGSVESTMVVEMPMVLTIEQLAPNPDNPRTSRNPRYDEIKASIKARGLDTVPKVTRDPDGDPNKYIFSDGGNTRYQILTELWHETGEERFFRIHVLVKPWPGRLQCVIGHLAENEVRGDLSFIEKARGIHKARIIYEEQLGKSVSLRELSTLLTSEGLPVHNSTISRMEDALKYLFPWMPDLLESGLGAPQIRLLLALRQDAEKVWDQFCLLSERSDKCFTDVFGECCRKFNSPELWSPEMFRDEFIGDLLLALPHPDLNYDRWVMELDPGERNRRYHFGEPEEATRLQGVVPSPFTDGIQDTAPEPDFALPKALTESPPATPAVTEEWPQQDENLRVSPEDNKEAPLSLPRTEVQPDMYGGSPVISGDGMGPGLSPDNDETLSPCWRRGWRMRERPCIRPVTLPEMRSGLFRLIRMISNICRIWPSSWCGNWGKSWGVKMKSCQTAPVVCRQAIALRVTAAAHRPPSFCPLRGVVRHSVRQPGWMLC